MLSRTLTLDIVSPWHAGTGRGEGAALDAVVVRSTGGLPYLPGRTLRGLLRQALVDAAAAGAVDSGTDEALFGSALAAELGEGDDAAGGLAAHRHRTRAGVLRVSNARLGASAAEAEAWERWAAASPGAMEHLYVRFASTAVAASTGSAKERTLRAIECAVPMTLHATLTGPGAGAAAAAWPDSIRAALPWLRAIGAHRNRGFGRVDARLT